MSVMIKGMEMPEHCGYCRFAYDGICHALQVTRFDKETKDGKIVGCPLVEIPTPHGRLIDADAATKGNINRTGKRLLAIDVAPTIIEAEGEE